MDKRIGAQLFTLRDFCQTEQDLDTTLKKVKEIGYQTVQVSAIGPIAAEKVKESADRYGLEIICTHKGYQDFKENMDKVVADHQVMDCKIAGLGAMPKEFQGDLSGVKQFIKEFNQISAELKKEGLQFGYHNHAFEFAKLDGKYIMDYILENTDPDDFRFIVDTYWLAVAGLDPAEYIKKLGPRALVIHFKDLAVSGNGSIMAEVMEGNLNWDKIFAACEESGAKYAMVEQDICQRDPFESIKISYENLCTKGFC